MLNLKTTTGTDPKKIDFNKLTHVPSQHAILSDVRDKAGTWVHQHAYLAYYDDRYWAMWSDGPGLPHKGASAEQHRNMVPGHDRPGTRNSYATSTDGVSWSEPADHDGNLTFVVASRHHPLAVGEFLGREVVHGIVEDGAVGLPLVG